MEINNVFCGGRFKFYHRLLRLGVNTLKAVRSFVIFTVIYSLLVKKQTILPHNTDNYDKDDSVVTTVVIMI